MCTAAPLLLVLLLGGSAFAQEAGNPRAVNYVFVEGRPIQLTPVTGMPVYRIQSNARVAQTASVRETLSTEMGIVSVPTDGATGPASGTRDGRRGPSGDRQADAHS